MTLVERDDIKVGETYGYRYKQSYSSSKSQLILVKVLAQDPRWPQYFDVELPAGLSRYGTRKERVSSARLLSMEQYEQLQNEQDLTDSICQEMQERLEQMGFKKQGKMGARLKTSQAEPKFVLGWQAMDQLLSMIDDASRPAPQGDDDPFAEILSGD